jgi:hypothetical protein
MNIHEIIKKAVTNTINESFATGEYWITDDGSTIYCDIDVSDQGHQGVIIEHCAREILSHFGIDVDESGLLGAYEESIKEILIDDGRLSEEEINEWNTKSPSEIILRKLIEDKVYPDEKQASEALYIAYGGTSSRDPRDYGMEYLHYKIAKTFGQRMEVQTWTLTEKDLSIIVRGLNDIWEDDSEDNDKPEDERDLVNVTVIRTGKVYHDIPLTVLEKGLVSRAIGFRKDQPWMAESINEDYHHSHSEYRLLEGDRLITAIFNDNSRLQFEIHFRDKKGRLEKEKYRKQAVSKWKSLAAKIYKENDTLDEVGNQHTITWKEAFSLALQEPELKEFIRDNHHQQIYPQENSGYELKQIYPYINPEDYNPNSSNSVGGRGESVEITGA